MEKISWIDRVRDGKRQKGGGITYIQYKEGRLTGLVRCCVGTALHITLLGEI
jgi:hypothetical protein